MPVSFEPSQPSNMSEIAQAYGAYEARLKDRDFQLRQAGQQQDYSAKMASLAQADSHFQQSQDPSNRDMFEAGKRNNQQTNQIAAGFAQQQQGADLQAQLASTQLNQAEDMRRQRLERQVNYIESNTGDGQRFAPDEAKDMITQLRTGLNPYQERMQTAQALQRTLANREMMEFHASQTGMTNAALGATADGMNSAPNRWQIRDENGDVTHQAVPDGRGGLTYLHLGGGSRSSSGSGSGGGAGGRDPFTAQHAYESLIHEREHAKGLDGQPTNPTPPTAAEVDARLQLLEGVRQRATERARAQAIAQPRGPLPFDRENRPPTALTWTENLQQGLNASIQTADRNRQTDRSETLRRIAVDMREGRTTGQLSPEQQQHLGDIGYYHHDFTPALDRELGRMESPTRVRSGTIGGGQGSTLGSTREAQGVWETQQPSPAQLIAVRGVRNLLGRYGSVERMPAMDSAAFQNHLATLRVFNWGRTEAERTQGRRGERDAEMAPRRAAPSMPVEEQGAFTGYY